ncbi:MAG: SsrA-binding protein [Acidimicrobiales bacterium]|nr:SsrA-binding protein [Acidimicrobiales bacterium]
MAASSKKQIAPPGAKVVASNRQARRDYEILDTFECGLVLKGSEVKSLRDSKVQLADAHARLMNGEVWLFGLHIAAYSHSGAADGHALERDKKLLLNRKEIDRIAARLQTERLALVPLALYFKEGRAKLELGVGRGRKNYDKRQAVAKRDAARDMDRSLAAARRRA